MQSLFSSFKNKVRTWRHDSRGATATLFALALLPTIGLVGLAVDYANVRRKNAHFQSIADAAALFAVSDRIVDPKLSWNAQKALVLATAKKQFEGQVAALGVVDAPVIPEYKVEKEGSRISLRLCYETKAKTMLMQTIGVSEVAFAGCSQAATALPVYVSVYALVDASGSMGIGASDSDRRLMQDRLGCVFACHTIDWRSNADCRNDWWSITTTCAHTIGARTRFDVIRSALAQVTDKAAALAKVPGQYKIAIYKFSNTLTRVQPLSGNMGSVRTALNAMTPDVQGAGTNFPATINDFLRELPTGGDGSSESSPRVYVMILTDGIGSNVYERPDCYIDATQPCRTNGAWLQDPRFVLESPNYTQDDVWSTAFQSRHCAPIKAKGITVMTLETEFNSSGSNQSHMVMVDTALRGTTHRELRQCASSESLSFAADQAADIDRAIGQMFASLVEKVRLTH